MLDAYRFGMPKSILSTDNLQLLLNLNLKCYALEEKGGGLIPPGLPEFLRNDSSLYSEYCINMNETIS